MSGVVMSYGIITSIIVIVWLFMIGYIWTKKPEKWGLYIFGCWVFASIVATIITAIKGNMNDKKNIKGRLAGMWIVFIVYIVISAILVYLIYSGILTSNINTNIINECIKRCKNKTSSQSSSSGMVYRSNPPPPSYSNIPQSQPPSQGGLKQRNSNLNYRIR